MPVYGYTTPDPVYLNFQPAIRNYELASTNALRRKQMGQEMEQAEQLFPLQLETAEAGLETAKAERDKKIRDAVTAQYEKTLKRIDDAFIMATPETAIGIVGKMKKSMDLKESDSSLFDMIYDQATGSITKESLNTFRKRLGTLTGRLKGGQEEAQEIRIAQAKKTDTKPAEQKLIEYRNTLPAGSDDRKVIDGILRKKATQTGMEFGTDENGNLFLRTGGAIQGAGATVPPSKKTINQLQADIIKNAGMLIQMRGVADQYSPSYLSLWGRAKNVGMKVADYLGALPDNWDPTEWYEARADFERSVEGLFNMYRKNITGAAASFQELQRLQKAFINMNLPPRAFRAKFASYITELQRMNMLYNRVLREGLQPDEIEGSKYNNRLNNLFNAKEVDSVEERGSELDRILKAQNAKFDTESDEQYQQRIDGMVEKQLDTEGYFNEKLFS